MSALGTSTFEVCVSDGLDDVVAGIAHISERRGAVSSTFTYAESFLARPDAYDISPEVPRSGGSRHHVTGLPGAFSDSSPDRWGRNLIAKRHRAAERETGGSPRSLVETDFLLGVSDVTRQGALRFRLQSGHDFLAPTEAEVPKLIDLPRLLNAAESVAKDSDEMAAVKVLLDAGSGSLGGARPKASVRDGLRLMIAKFPHPQDSWDVMAWEMTALDLAEQAGIGVPARSLQSVGGRSVLLLHRFDRASGQRIGYVSAMSLTQSADGAPADYLEIAEAIATYGGGVAADLRALWRRIAFSVAINNTDDHLRNHGFLRRRDGWRLSPAFDLNPNPDPRAERVTSIGYQSTRTEGLTALLGCVDDFNLTTNGAHRILQEVSDALSNWRRVASHHGIRRAEQDQFAEAFQSPHDSL